MSLLSVGGTKTLILFFAFFTRASIEKMAIAQLKSFTYGTKRPKEIMCHTTRQSWLNAIAYTQLVCGAKPEIQCASLISTSLRRSSE